MKIERTLFDDDGRPLGQAVQDTQTSVVRFVPHGDNEPRPTLWLSVEACREAILQQPREVSK